MALKFEMVGHDRLGAEYASAGQSERRCGCSGCGCRCESWWRVVRIRVAVGQRARSLLAPAGSRVDLSRLQPLLPAQRAIQHVPFLLAARTSASQLAHAAHVGTTESATAEGGCTGTHGTTVRRCSRSLCKDPSNMKSFFVHPQSLFSPFLRIHICSFSHFFSKKQLGRPRAIASGKTRIQWKELMIKLELAVDLQNTRGIEGACT